MSLILVVEPDSRHAAQLASMARNHLHAELVMAESGDRAVAALADRVPDIVLTAPLLPHQDEAVLSDYLRALGDAAAHVQTLTIPILSAPGGSPRVAKGRFRREKDRVVPDGCDPALFAEQVGQYLRRARQARTDGIAALQFERRQETLDEPAALPSPMIEAISEPESAAGDIDLTSFLRDEPEPVVTYEPPAYVSTPDPVLSTPEPVLSIPEPVRQPDPFARPRRHIVVPEVLPPERPDVIPAQLVDAPSPVPPLRSRSAEVPPVIDPEPDWHSEPVMTTSLPAVVRPEQRPAETTPVAHVPQVITVPAPHGNGQAVNVAVAVSVQVAARAASPTPPSTPRQRSKTPKPAQDEWGFFDPDQCGFRALLARLDAIAGTDESGS